MANQKITELTEYTTAINDDVVPIVDTVSDITKKMKIGTLLARPHATISDNTIQTVGSTSAEYPVVFSTNDHIVNVTHTLGESKIYLPIAGCYLLSISSVIDTTNKTAALFDLWLKVNGSNVVDSNTQVGINDSNLQQILAVTFIYDFSANDYFEFFYHASSTAARILAVASGLSPTRPACPSSIVAITKVSC